MKIKHKLEWFDRAFGKERDILHYKFRWFPDKIQVEKDKLKGITYKVRISYKMFTEVPIFFNIFVINLIIPNKYEIAFTFIQPK